MYSAFPAKEKSPPERALSCLLSFGLSEESEYRLRVRVRLCEDRGSDLHQDLKLGELSRSRPDVEVSNLRFRRLHVDSRDVVVVRIFVEADDDGTEVCTLVEQRLQRLVEFCLACSCCDYQFI